jgi:hypothetical protein
VVPVGRFPTANGSQQGATNPTLESVVDQYRGAWAAVIGKTNNTKIVLAGNPTKARKARLLIYNASNGYRWLRVSSAVGTDPAQNVEMNIPNSGSCRLDFTYQPKIAGENLTLTFGPSGTSPSGFAYNDAMYISGIIVTE